MTIARIRNYIFNANVTNKNKTPSRDDYLWTSEKDIMIDLHSKRAIEDSIFGKKVVVYPLFMSCNETFHRVGSLALDMYMEGYDEVYVRGHTGGRVSQINLIEIAEVPPYVLNEWFLQTSQNAEYHDVARELRVLITQHKYADAHALATSFDSMTLYNGYVQQSFRR